MYYLLKGEIIFHQKYQLKEVKTMKKIIVVVVMGSLIAGTVAWYAAGVYAQGGRGQGLNSWSGPRSGYTQMLETRAQILGISTEELQRELDAGKSMGDIAKEKGLTSEEFHQKMLAAKKIHLGNLVKAGVLTPEQLETRVRLMEQYYADCDCDENCDGTDEDHDKPRWGRMGRDLGEMD